MGKIEKGCLAIVVNGAYPNHPQTNIGKIVRIGSFLGDLPRWQGSDYWETDSPQWSENGDDTCFNRECYLQRIDEDIVTNENIVSITVDLH